MCKVCSNTDIETTEKTTTKYIIANKDWMLNALEDEKSNESRATIELECPNKDCVCTRMFFYTRQLRNADEGETVFYECIKCGHKFQLNN